MKTVYQFQSAQLIYKGSKRHQNKDFVIFCKPDNPDGIQASGDLYIVADGVGVAAKRELVSR